MNEHHGTNRQPDGGDRTELTAAVPGPPSPVGTGDPRVDEAMTTLDGLDSRPLADHVEAFDAVHQALQDALATVDGE